MSSTSGRFQPGGATHSDKQSPGLAHMKSVLPRKVSGKLLLSFSLSFLMAGCATTGAGQQPSSTKSFASDWLHKGNSVTYLSEEHSSMLEKAAPGDVVSFSRTPWGEDTRVEVNRSYFSASGKPCFSTSIMTRNAAPSAVNLCKYSSGRWGATRAFSPTEPGGNQLTVGGAQ